MIDSETKSSDKRSRHLNDEKANSYSSNQDTSLISGSTTKSITERLELICERFELEKYNRSTALGEKL